MAHICAERVLCRVNCTGVPVGIVSVVVTGPMWADAAGAENALPVNGAATDSTAPGRCQRLHRADLPFFECSGPPERFLSEVQALHQSRTGRQRAAVETDSCPSAERSTISRCHGQPARASWACCWPSR